MATQFNTTNTSRFHNLSPAMLADLIGQLDKQAKAAAAELEAAKDAFKATGFAVAQGECFAIALQKTIRQTLDTAKVKAVMGQGWFDDNSRLSEVSSLRVTTATPISMAA